MSNWYAFKRVSDGTIVSFGTDDSAGFNLAVAGLTPLGPYATLQAAQAANGIVLPVPSAAITALQAKPVATWTLADIATWLQNGG